MSLYIFNNRTEHTHENEQFRRVVEIIETTFDRLGYDGLLIGNPSNETYYRFRADAILYYNNGIILIDFKDYRGIIKLPPNESEFHTAKWHNESEKDRSRLEIKAGSKFINPFKQLVYYRNAFREIIESNTYLNAIVNSSRVCIANIFSGPIEVKNEIPRNLPYYKIVQEADLGQFLYDFASENTFSNEVVDVLKNILPAEKWIKTFELKQEEKIREEKIVEIEKDVETEITVFLQDEETGILVLESMNVADRDSWVKFLQNTAPENNIPQVETWSHSSRISKKILNRTQIATDGIYSVIYGGTHKVEEEIPEKNENEEQDKDEELLEIIPVKSSESIDDKALIIIHEAHLINRSLNQSELLRFGTGRLLEDIIKFLNPQSNRKIAFVGDPYLLSYGKNEDSALNLDTLSELYSTKKIKHFRKEIADSFSNNKGKEKLAADLAKSIENKLFNNLTYDFDDISIKKVQGSDIQKQIKLWFEKPFEKEPNNAVLFYSKKDCLQTNKWIKKQCLNNGEQLATGDLLIANNNITIPDETGFTVPKKIVNGMYVTVLSIKENKEEFIHIKQTKNPIPLTFTKLSVKCLSLNSKPETDLWILDNFFQSEDDLSREEKIAFRVFINQRINEKKKNNKFEDSKECKQLFEDEKYKSLSEDEKIAIKQLIQNYSLEKEKRQKIETTKVARKLLSDYNKRYSQNIFLQLRKTDPFVNALFVKYGWAITVHKALGGYFDEIILKGFRKENDGITNDDYFRWLYSAVSSTNNCLSINKPQRINPLMKCVFEDNSINGIAGKSKQFLVFDNYEPEQRFTDKVQAIENKNVVGTICEVSKLLEQKEYLLESSKKFSEYLTKAFYSIPQRDNKLILDIDNKGAKDNFAVGNIRIENLNSADESIVKQCIEGCLTQKQNTISLDDENPALPTDFRKTIYEIWFNGCKSQSISLKIVQNHNNQDIFLATRENEKLKFRVWYGTSEQQHTKGFINKIEVLEKTSDCLTHKIKEICIGITE